MRSLAIASLALAASSGESIAVVAPPPITPEAQ